MSISPGTDYNTIVFGGAGQLARSLRQIAWPKDFKPVFLPHAQCDVTDQDAVKSALDALAPMAVINAAAYTNVDRAEAEEDKAARTNAQGAEILARSCAARRIPLIHVSTDYVFDGRQDVPYTESAAAAPLNAYGRTKLAGDEAIQAHAARYLIFRSSWVYSEGAGNFVTKMLELAGTRPELNVVSDQTGCPTYAPDLARAIIAVLPRCIEREAGVQGLFNFAGAGETTWFDFAQAIIAGNGDRARPVIKPITTATYGAAALRPGYSALDCSKARDVLGIANRDWRDSLSECLAKIST
jgi:dTDP-4-dehydrorhamnose reductase